MMFYMKIERSPVTPAGVAVIVMIFVSFAAPAFLFAHPHMGLNTSFNFVWKGDRLSGVYLDWQFDDYFSADILQGYDLDRNGRFDAKETQAVHDGAFANLGKYFFFTFIRQGETRSNPKSVRDFSVYAKDGKLHYRFLVDLSMYKGELFIAVYDYTYFCAIDYRQPAPVSFTHDPRLVKPFAEVVENKKYPVYYNPQGAIDDTTVYYSWKKGLETFFPKEIRLVSAPAKP